MIQCIFCKEMVDAEKFMNHVGICKQKGKNE